jgi:FkbM family methyltransferase
MFMIPEIFHRVWLGSAPIPHQYERYWHAWQRQYPQHRFITWRDADIDTSFSLLSAIQTATGFARKADIARYEILLQHGGIYLDCDMMPYHYFPWHELTAELLICNETVATDYCSIGMIAAAKNHPVLQAAVDGLKLSSLNLRPPNVETGPYYFLTALSAGVYEKLPVAAFYPYLGNEPYSAILSRDLSRTFGIHVWGGSWFDEMQKIEKLSTLMKQGDLVEINCLGQKVNESLKEHVLSFTALTENARQSLLKAANHPLLSDHLALDSAIEFELLKCAFYLLDTDPTAEVWQIGAADGILVDPLRPLLINYNPKAYLLEPNPFLFSCLTQNLAKNTNSQLLQVALGAESRKLHLHAVHPEKAKSANLPAWVAGISSFYTNRNALGGLTIDEHLHAKINACVETIPVEVITVQQLLQLTNRQVPDVVVIDVEGMDVEIVELLLAESIRPKILQFEIQCLPANEITHITKQLNAEYIQFDFGNDRVSYRKDFFKAYADYLYVQYGKPTYYKNVFRDLVKCD